MKIWKPFARSGDLDTSHNSASAALVATGGRVSHQENRVVSLEERLACVVSACGQRLCRGFHGSECVDSSHACGFRT